MPPSRPPSAAVALATGLALAARALALAPVRTPGPGPTLEPEAAAAAPGVGAGLAALMSQGGRLEAVRLDATGRVRLLAGRLTGPRRGDPTALARGFIAGAADLLAIPAGEAELVAVSARETVLGTVVRFGRRLDGLPLDPGAVVVAVDPAGSIRWLLREGPAGPIRLAPPGPRAGVDPLAIARADLAPRAPLRAPPRVRRMVAAREGRGEVLTEVLLASRVPRGDWLYRIDAAGRVRSREDRLCYARGRIFAPNPVVAARDPTLRDQGDAAAAVPASAYSEVELDGLDGSGTLTGEYASTEATEGRAFEPSGAFLYDRADPRFEEVMAYQAVDQAQRAFQAAGIPDANRRRQPIDAHGTSEDNSWYSHATGRLTFGTGGVDDAEDAEVVWHEYGHATQDDQVPTWGSGWQARAMGEGFGDFLAGVLSARVSGFQVECVGDWDGTAYSHAEPPCLRRLDSPKHFPEDLKGEVHDDGEIWSAALWQVHARMDASPDALKLVLAHHFLLNPASTMPDAALAILAADAQLFGGAHRRLLRGVFRERGLLPPEAVLVVALRDREGRPLAGTARLGTRPDVAIPAGTGEATLAVPPGSYPLAVRAFGYRSPPPRPVELPDGEQVRAELVLDPAPPARRAGRVLSPGGAGLPVRVRLPGTPLPAVEADADGRFALEAPAGSYEVVVAAPGFATQRLAAVELPGPDLELVLEPVPEVLLVAADGAPNYEAYFQAALGDLGRTVRTVVPGPGGLVPADELSPYQAVVWLAGDRGEGVVPEAAQAALREYLAQGGALALSGKDLGFPLKGRPFYREVLGARFVRDGAGSKGVTGAGLALVLAGGDGAGNQGYPDVIAPEGSAAQWLAYGTGEGAAVLHDVGPGRAVYLAFGLEGVATREGRRDLMGAMLAALGLAPRRGPVP